jgi:Nitroreductase
MNEVIQNMVDRRSIRSFGSRQIDDSDLDDILTAGMYAPNGKGAQSAKIVVIQDRETISQLSAMNAKILGADTDPFYGAPTVLVVLADKSVNTYIEDGALVIGNLMNAAHSLGIDSIWVHRAKEEFAGSEGKALLEKWGIDGDYAGVGHCCLGYRNCEYPEASPRKKDYVIKV